jgi:hypothetical protein
MDHQMNVRISEQFSLYFARIPLTTAPHIHHENALLIDWGEVLPPERCSYVLGNPPFVGKQHQTAEQKADLERVCRGFKGAGVLDLVTAWYFKAAEYVRNTKIGCALVSTNSITQGEQVGVLWAWLLSHGVKIHFAHRTFRWSNEGRGMAAVHCVIVGFGAFDTLNKVIFEYDDVDGEPHAVPTGNINPYLVDAPDVVLGSRRNPVCNVSEIRFGSMPNDGGNLLLSDVDKNVLLAAEPAAAQWIRPFLSAEEFINRLPRWCLWLVDCPPNVLRKMPEVARRVAKVKEHRLASDRATTRNLAATPMLFGEVRQPRDAYVLIPRHSSERRRFVPMGFFTEGEIVGDSNLCIPDASRYEFGILSSTPRESSTTTSPGPKPRPTGSARRLKLRRRACSTPGHSSPTRRWPISTTR